MRGSTISRILLCTVLVASLVGVSPPVVASACSTTLHWLNPLPRGETLNAVSMASADGNVAYAVGNNGCTIKTYNGGQSWVQKSSPVSSDLYAVSFIDSTHGWAAGEGGAILKMIDGASYQLQTSGTTNDVRGIFFRNSNLGWACTDGGEVLRTTNGGTNWTADDLGDYYFTEIHFVSDTKGFVVSGNGDIFVSTDGGATWPTHIDKGDAVSFEDISFDPDDPQIGWIASGNGSPWKTSDGGATWDTVTAGTSWHAVECAGNGSNIVWLAGMNSQPDRLGKVTDGAVPSIEVYNDSDYGKDMPLWGIDCSSGTKALAVGLGGQVTFTEDGGATWGHRAQTAPRDYLTAIQMVDFRTGYLCAGNGVWKTGNAGTSWAQTTTPAGGILYALHFLDVNTGWAVGSGGRILKTTNGGASWAQQTTGVSDELTAVYFTDASHGWAAGDNGRLLWTNNGGGTWNATTLGTSQFLAIDFFGSDLGAVVGRNGAVYVTSNAGTNGGNWVAGGATGSGGSLDLEAVDYAAANALYIGGAERTILAAGNATVLKSTNGGAAWGALVPADLTKRNEFMSYGYVTDLSFSSATTGWAALSNGSVAYTTDSGNTWTYGTAMDTNMQDISVIGGEYIWACASNGRVMSNYWYETTKVYRFYNMKNGTHFYTASYDEKMNIIKTWPDVYKYEGVGYEYDGMKASQPLYRFYNKVSGSHFYTVSVEEKNNVIAKWPNVYTYEGPAYNVSNTPVGGGVVYRFYNVKTGSHFFTASASERDTVIATWPDVFKYEGEAYYLPM